MITTMWFVMIILAFLTLKAVCSNPMLDPERFVETYKLAADTRALRGSTALDRAKVWDTRVSGSTTCRTGDGQSCAAQPP